MPSLHVETQPRVVATLLEIARDPRHLGAEIGFFSVLHTWDLQHYPHVHCVVAADGLAPDHSRWISSRRCFFLPVQVLSRVFRGKLSRWNMAIIPPRGSNSSCSTSLNRNTPLKERSRSAQVPTANHE